MNRELKAVLEVYTRKIRTFIDTQISRINTNLRVAYEHLVSRTSKYTVNYDIADRTIWDSEHLLSAITAFSSRKISNGSAPNDGIKDGVSLARLLCADYADVVELKDDTHGWIYSRNSLAQFPNAKKITLGFKSSDITIISGHQNVEELVLTDAEVISRNQMSYTFISNCPKLKKIDGQAFKRFSSSNGSMMISNCAALEEIDLRNSEYIYSYVNVALIYGCPNLKKLRLGQLGMAAYDGTTDNIFGKASYQTSDTSKLEDIEFSLLDKNTNLCQWNPTDKGTTFLQNFLEHICQRLANRTGQTKLTLTLSADVYDAVKGTNGGYASTHTLGEICGESLVLTPLEIELGITENTIYSTWLTTYFGENGINWNIETPN